MLRTFAAFLLVFWLLGLAVHLDGLIHVFGAGALMLLAADLIATRASARPRISKVHVHTLL